MVVSLVNEASRIEYASHPAVISLVMLALCIIPPHFKPLHNPSTIDCHGPRTLPTIPSSRHQLSLTFPQDGLHKAARVGNDSANAETCIGSSLTSNHSKLLHIKHWRACRTPGDLLNSGWISEYVILELRNDCRTHQAPACLTCEAFRIGYYAVFSRMRVRLWL